MLSSEASQRITYHCWNSVAHAMARRGGHRRKALTLMSWNDLEIRHRGRFSYNVLEDGCQHERRQWDKTVVEVAHRKPARLPVVDVELKDVGSNDQKFSLEIGEVCFKWEGYTDRFKERLGISTMKKGPEIQLPKKIIWKISIKTTLEISTRGKRFSKIKPRDVDKGGKSRKVSWTRRAN